MPCVFCGFTGKLTNEHAWPQWIAEVRPDLAKNPSSAVGPVGGVHETRSHGPFEIEVGCVCEDCNCGWMSDLEVIAKPILTKMLRGNNRTLFSPSQRVVATWAFKTALMLREATFPRADSGRGTVPATHYRHLYDHAEPPQSVTIWLAGFIGSDWASFFRETSGPIQIRGDKDVVKPISTSIYGQVLLAGNLVFQIFGHALPPDDGLGLTISPRGVAGKKLIRIWPTPIDTPRVKWPPEVVLDDVAFNGFAQSIRVLLRTLPPG